jgi:hypothetical protein
VERLIDARIVAAHDDAALIPRRQARRPAEGDEGESVFRARSAAALQHHLRHVPPPDHLVLEMIDHVVVDLPRDPVGVRLIGHDLLHQVPDVRAVDAVARAVRGVPLPDIIGDISQRLRIVRDDQVPDRGDLCLDGVADGRLRAGPDAIETEQGARLIPLIRRDRVRPS